MLKKQTNSALLAISTNIQGVFFHWYPPKSSKYKQVNQAWLGVSRPIYVNVDSPNLGFPYFNFLGGYQWNKLASSKMR